MSPGRPGLVEACDIFGNAHPGVVVERSADPLLRNCRIHHGRSNGVGFIGHALGVVEDSDIFSNAYAGIGIKQESNPEIRHCAIYSGKGGGILVTEQCLGEIEDCDIFKNDSHGVAIGRKGIHSSTIVASATEKPMVCTSARRAGGWLRNATYHSMPWDHGISSRGAGRAAREIGLD